MYVTSTVFQISVISLCFHLVGMTIKLLIMYKFFTEFYRLIINIYITLQVISQSQRAIMNKTLCCYRDALAFESYSLNIKERACLVQTPAKITFSPNFHINISLCFFSAWSLEGSLIIGINYYFVSLNVSLYCNTSEVISNQ